MLQVKCSPAAPMCFALINSVDHLLLPKKRVADRTPKLAATITPKVYWYHPGIVSSAWKPCSVTSLPQSPQKLSISGID